MARKKRKKQNRAKYREEYKKTRRKEERHQSALFQTKPCHEPGDFEIAPGKRVYLSSRTSIFLDDILPPEKLDVFLGLDSMFNDLAAYSYNYHVARDIATILKDGGLVYRQDGIDKIALTPIDDGEIDIRVLDAAIALIDAGKYIGFGCLAGHGRTGWLLARLIMHYTGVDGDAAVSHIRNHYCKRAVESTTQIKDLGCKAEKAAFSWLEKYTGKTKSPIGYATPYLKEVYLTCEDCLRTYSTREEYYAECPDCKGWNYINRGGTENREKDYNHTPTYNELETRIYIFDCRECHTAYTGQSTERYKTCPYCYTYNFHTDYYYGGAGP